MRNRLRRLENRVWRAWDRGGWWVAAAIWLVAAVIIIVEFLEGWMAL